MEYLKLPQFANQTKENTLVLPAILLEQAQDESIFLFDQNLLLNQQKIQFRW